MAREWRTERCFDCGSMTEREWETDVIPKGMPVPKGWRVDSRWPSWKEIARPTRWVVMCDCDATE